MNISEYDLRQYGEMNEQIHNFETGQINLEHLVAGLKTLRNMLENPNPNWESQFIINWSVLEMANANMINKKLEKLSDAEAALLNKAIDNIRSMLWPYLNAEPNEPANN